MNTVYKIALVGETCVGKSSFIKKCINGNFDINYHPDTEAKVSVFNVCTSEGEITFSIWEFNSKTNLETLQYFDAAIIMSSVNDKNSIHNIPKWIKLLEEKNNKIPITICVNKKDLKYQTPYNINKKYACFSVSTKSGDNIRSPLVYLAKKLLENTDLNVY